MDLKELCPASRYIGLHFQWYDDFILPPVIKKEIIVHSRQIKIILPSIFLPIAKI